MATRRRNGGNPNHWIPNSGASEHFTPQKHILINYYSLDEPVEANTAQRKLDGIGTGTVHITVEGQDGHLKVTLEEVLHVPGMDSNLLSSNALLGKGLEINMHPTKGTNIPSAISALIISGLIKSPVSRLMRSSSSKTCIRWAFIIMT